MMTTRATLLCSHLAVGVAIALASGCDSRLLVGNNPDASGNGGASGAAGSSVSGTAGTRASAGDGGGGAAGTMMSTGTAGGGGSPTPPTDAGIPLDAWIAFDSDGGAFN